jgi:hypothetical protein
MGFGKGICTYNNPGELRIFHTGQCPPGWKESGLTKGYLLMGRPEGGKAGTMINRPMNATEKDRTPAHTHRTSVVDPGHTHTTTVNDPGHGHTGQSCKSNGGSHSVNDERIPTPWKCDATFKVDPSKTGIAVDAQTALTGLSVTNNPNEGGEGYPLAYVLICQFTGS